MPVITIDQLKEKFEYVEVRTIDDLMKWIERQTIARSPDYADVIAEAHQKILDSHIVLGFVQPQYKNRNLGDYAGFSHARLQSVFGLSSAEATEIQTALGVMEA